MQEPIPFVVATTDHGLSRKATFKIEPAGNKQREQDYLSGLLASETSATHSRIVRVVRDSALKCSIVEPLALFAGNLGA